MNIVELIEKLQALPKDTNVGILGDGYYFPLRDLDFFEDETCVILKFNNLEEYVDT